MTRWPILPLPPHQATPVLAALTACGLVGRAEALAAFISASGPVTPPRQTGWPAVRQADVVPAQASSRAAAAQAVRAAVTEILKETRSRSRLRQVAVLTSRSALGAADIEELLAQSIDQHLRSVRRTDQPPHLDRPSTRLTLNRTAS